MLWKSQTNLLIIECWLRNDYLIRLCNLLRGKGLFDRYNDVFSDYLEKGYAGKISRTGIEDCWYIPHQILIDPVKVDKIRVVFNANVIYRNVDLNSCLQTGPDLCNNLVGILLRFREENIAVVADIETMFHQVKVSDHDDEYLFNVNCSTIMDYHMK